MSLTQGCLALVHWNNLRQTLWRKHAIATESGFQNGGKLFAGHVSGKLWPNSVHPMTNQPITVHNRTARRICAAVRWLMRQTEQVLKSDSEAQITAGRNVCAKQHDRSGPVLSGLTIQSSVTNRKIKQFHLLYISAIEVKFTWYWLVALSRSVRICRMVCGSRFGLPSLSWILGCKEPAF